MKRIILAVLVVVLLAVSAAAGTITVSITTTAAQDIKLARLLTRINGDTCVALGLPRMCTDAQAKAKDPDSTIYASMDAYSRDVLLAVLANRFREQDQSEGADYCTAWKALTNAQRNTDCTAKGLPTGCTPCS